MLGSMRGRLWFVSLLFTAALFFAVRPSRAASCNDTSTFPNTLVIESGDTQEPLLKALGKKLRDSQTNPVNLLYITTGSCTLIDDMVNKRPIAAGTNLFYLPSATEDPTWDVSKASPTCTVNTALPIDIAISATFVSSCTQTAVPAPLGTINGPIQGYTFVVPKASQQQAITAEEAYFTFGFGQNGQVQPWLDEQFLFIRPPTKSTVLTMAAAIGVPAAKWKGQPRDKSGEVLNLVATSPNPEKTIGILGAEVFDANREKVSVLAYRAYKQRYAYFPDSTPTSFDKKNLRDGHYTPWAPTVYITAVDAQNVPTGQRAKLFVDLVLGNTITPKPDVDGLATVISKGLIPDCAMKVSRQFEGGNLSLYTPAAACSCYYESKVQGSKATCTACTDDGPCNGGTCRRGVCEAK